MNSSDLDPGSLDRLHDIVVPPPIPWWPPAPGWYAVGAVGLAVLAAATWILAVRWSRNRYRRQALAEVNALEAGSRSIPALATLIKRVALASYPRERVASLTGPRWLAFLDETGGEGAFTAGPGKELEAGYRPGAQRADPALIAAVRRWIEVHRC